MDFLDNQAVWILHEQYDMCSGTDCPFIFIYISIFPVLEYFQF